MRVQKRQQPIEPFLRDKLFLSIYQSISHLKEPVAQAHYLTNTVLRHILKEVDGPLITTDKIALITVQTLKRYNAAAAVRYLAFQKPMPRPSDINHSLK
jgi:transcriptional regulator NrdR family protein